MSEKNLIAISIIFSSLILGVGIYFTTLLNKKDEAGSEKNSIEKINKIERVLPAKEHIEGSKKADVYVITYFDLECLGCKIFNEIMKDLVKKYSDNDRVGFVYRQFPLYKTISGVGEALHKSSGVEARALECAGKLGGDEKFFKMKDKIFETTKSDGEYPVHILSSIAEDININQKDFEKCVSSKDTIKKVDDDLKKAYDSEIKFTPSVYIQMKGNEEILEVSPSKEIIDNIINIYLKKN